MRLVVTGGSGFVGRHVIASAAARGVSVVAPARSAAAAAAVERSGATAVRVADLADPAVRGALQGADAVAHLAMIGAEPAGQSFEQVNVEGTRAVVSAAAAAGVRRLVLFSGLGVARYGQAPRSTNRYFLSKLRAEMVAFGSALEVVVLRPSYIVGPGDGFLTLVLRQLREGVVERPGDGAYRLQPVAVADAAEAVLAGVTTDVGTGRSPHRVVDLVGPRPLAFREFVPAVAAAARAAGLSADFTWREIPVAEADRAAAAGGWQGMPPEELDCVLCDETADPRPLEELLGRTLTPLAEAIRVAVEGTAAGR